MSTAQSKPTPKAPETESDPVSKPTQGKSNRLVMVATNKGGVGKSTAIIHIGDFLLQAGIPFVAFDPDHANHSLARFFTKEDGEREEYMKLINIADDSSLDQITKVFDEGVGNLVLVDGVGALQEAFQTWIEEIALFERAEDMDLKITFILVVDEDKDTVEQAMQVASWAGDQVDYLVIKNLKTTESTSIYDNSAVRKTLVNMLGAKEITFPKMKGNLVPIIQDKSLRLSEAEKSSAVYVNDRYRVSAYRKRVFKEIEAAKERILP